MNRFRVIAICSTAAIAALTLLWLLLCHLEFDPSVLRFPPRPTTEIVELEEEYVDLLSDIAVPTPSDPKTAYTQEPSHNKSVPQEAAGSDLEDKGLKGAELPDVVSEQPSPVKQPKKTEKPKTGPTKEELEAQARRKARQGVGNAFAKSEENADNTLNHGAAKGDSGNPSGEASDINGIGQGTVGGGWKMPIYNKVDSYSTGSIIIRAIIDKNGQVVEINQIGGRAPASADSRLVAKCIAEIKSKKFTRNDDNAPDRAEARITYTFK